MTGKKTQAQVQKVVLPPPDEEVKTIISMRRDQPQFPGGPVTAQVAHDMIPEWLADGWEIA